MRTEKTDWDSYYSRPYATASLTRRITASKLLGLVREFAPEQNHPLRIVELGGANSCFCGQFVAELKPDVYDVVDNNELGLAAFNRKRLPGVKANGHLIDVLSDGIDEIAGQYDVCYSVGLIEHFEPHNTACAIAAHFKAIRPNGIVIMTYPTPTWLYQATRKLAELSGQWIFWDERPLQHAEVEQGILAHGELLSRRTNWWIFLTQGIIVAQKSAAASANTI